MFGLMALVNARYNVVEELRIEKVADLLIPETKWNKPLIERVFFLVTMAKILFVPLSLQKPEDVLFWTGTTIGGYTTRSRYDFIQ